MEHATANAPLDVEGPKSGETLQGDPGPAQAEAGMAGALAAGGGDRLEQVRKRIGEGRPDLAEAACRDLLSAGPAPAALHLMAIAVSLQGRVGQAEVLLRSAVDREPGNAGLLYDHGVALSKLGRYADAVERYHQALAREPHHAEALNNCGTALMELGRPDEALAAFDRAIASRPVYAQAWSNRGRALLLLRRPGEALQSLETALELAPDYARALSHRGLALMELGRMEEAVTSFERALRLEPHDPVTLNNAGVACNNLGRREDALRFYEQAVALKPDYVEAQFNRGNALHRLGRPAEALAVFDAVVARRPDQAEAHTNRASVLLELGDRTAALASADRALALRPDLMAALNVKAAVLASLGRLDEAAAVFDAAPQATSVTALASAKGMFLFKHKRIEAALACFDRALALDPWVPEFHFNRASALGELGRHADAVQAYDRVLTLRPDYADAHSNRGNSLLALDRVEEALTGFRAATRLRPGFYQAFNNESVALNTLGRSDEALAAADRAVALAPDWGDAHTNRGNALVRLGRVEDGIAAYEQAVAFSSDTSGPRFNLALALLTVGDFTRGWAEYEARWGNPQMASGVRDFAQPLWLGQQDLAGKTILLHGEQGWGDMIMFSRYARLVAERGATVLFEAPSPLIPLLESLLGPSRFFGRGAPLPAFDLHCPLMSLPHAFGTTLATVPGQVPYLMPSQERLALWAHKLARERRPRIGLAWSGSRSNRNDRARSLRLEMLAPVLQCGAAFHFLQPDLRHDDVVALARFGSITHHGPALRDFADTAALIMQLDLVISVDTSVAHLAGALGKPVWILVPFAPDFRWLLERTDSPWYPTARLFRQQAINDWESALMPLLAALEPFMAPSRRAVARG